MKFPIPEARISGPAFKLGDLAFRTATDVELRFEIHSLTEGRIFSMKISASRSSQFNQEVDNRRFMPRKILSPFAKLKIDKNHEAHAIVTGFQEAKLNQIIAAAFLWVIVIGKNIHVFKAPDGAVVQINLETREPNKCASFLAKSGSVRFSTSTTTYSWRQDNLEINIK